jgi:DNA-binding NtrC family response regulator
MAIPLRALLVEDNADDADLLLYELKTRGFSVSAERVWTAARFRERLTEPFDVILADYTVPSFGAVAALEILRETGVDIPLIVVTGTIGEETAVACMRDGAVDYLLKDRLTRLGAAVEQALEQRRSQRAQRQAEEALHERLAFETLLARVGTSLVQTADEELDAELVSILAEVGSFVRASRALIASGTSERLLVTHEWRDAALAHGRRSSTDARHIDLGATHDWWKRLLASSEGLAMPRTDVPSAVPLAHYMDDHGLSEAVISAHASASGVADFVAFFAQQPAEIARSTAVGRIKLVADVMATTLARKRADEQRAEAFLELERLKRAAEDERDYLRAELRDDRGLGQIIGQSAALKHVLEMVDAVAQTRATVLIKGESGVGKELVARAIHERSDRSGGPLVKVNCASVPNELFESEFFGHVRGSFTGAHRNRVGRFELAHGGTLFLDEVGEIPQTMQSKLLRVLQENEFERVGDDRTRQVDVRVVAATNRDLAADVEAGSFRRDLFYRLNVFPLEVPPLRQRRDDILPLAEAFLWKYRAALRRPPLELTSEQRAALAAYDWPGNVRELAHVIERAVILSSSGVLRLDLALATTPRTGPPKHESEAVMTEHELRALERDNLVAALTRSGWRISGANGAAQLLGVNPSTLRDRMRALGIERER